MRFLRGGEGFGTGIALTIPVCVFAMVCVMKPPGRRPLQKRGSDRERLAGVGSDKGWPCGEDNWIHAAMLFSAARPVGCDSSHRSCVRRSVR